MTSFPEEYTDLFRKPTIGHLATINPGGTPHVTPVWVDFDGEHILVNTQTESRKARNARSTPHVAVSMTDPDNPYRRVVIIGKVCGWQSDDSSHKDRLAERYLGTGSFPLNDENTERVVLEIFPEVIAADESPLGEFV